MSWDKKVRPILRRGLRLRWCVNMPDDSRCVASGIYSCASVGFFGSNGKDTVSGLGILLLGIHDKTGFSDFVTPSQDIIAELRAT